ncbi:hypothetical protein [Agromyces sp. GXS1127]
MARNPDIPDAFDVMEWWVAAGSLAFPLADRAVGGRRSMPDD